MKSFQIKNILIPTDFSKTSLLAVEHAAFMARLCKADLYLLHVVEISETIFRIYNPEIMTINVKEIEKIAITHLNDFAKKLSKEYGIIIKTLCSSGRTAYEVVTAVKENDIDVLVMGTHGASGFDELFRGSNAQKIVTVCPCPVITVQTHAKKLGFTNIVLPIDNSFHSRQKVDFTVTLAKKFSATIHILGLLSKDKSTDLQKFKIKLDSVEKVIKNAGLPYVCKTVKSDNLAETAMKYSKKVKADLIVVLTDHESHLTGMFLDVFSKQIVNHSKIPVMSIRPMEGIYNSISLAGANPF